jgi:hypothetical protein
MKKVFILIGVMAIFLGLTTSVIGANVFITPYQDGVTTWSASDLNAPLLALDKVAGVQQNAIVSSDGAITYASSTGTLTWASSIRIVFNNSAGNAVENTVAASNIVLADNEFAYVDLNETDGTVVLMGSAAITTDTTSNFSSTYRIVMGYRNTTSDDFYPVALKEAFGQGGTASSTTVDITNFDGNLSASDTDVLTALETLDDAVYNSTTISTNVTNFDNNLSASDTTVQAALETLDELIATGSSNSGGFGVSVYEYTAGASQTEYTGSDDNTATLDLSNSYPLVAVANGLLSPDEFIYNSTVLTLDVAPTTSDDVSIWAFSGSLETLMTAVSDEVSDLTTGITKVTFRMPYAFYLQEVRANVITAPTGANIQVDINESGVSILSTVLSIDATEKTSTTATTAAVISDNSLADDAEITIDIDQVGSTVAGVGLKITFLGVQL